MPSSYRYFLAGIFYLYCFLSDLILFQCWLEWKTNPGNEVFHFLDNFIFLHAASASSTPFPVLLTLSNLKHRNAQMILNSVDDPLTTSRKLETPFRTGAYNLINKLCLQFQENVHVFRLQSERDDF